MSSEHCRRISRRKNFTYLNNLCTIIPVTILQKCLRISFMTSRSFVNFDIIVLWFNLLSFDSHHELQHRHFSPLWHTIFCVCYTYWNCIYGVSHKRNNPLKYSFASFTLVCYNTVFFLYYSVSMLLYIQFL